MTRTPSSIPSQPRSASSASFASSELRTARCRAAALRGFHFTLSLASFGGLAVLAALAALATGCADDIAQPYELSHPRLLALRTEPAALPAGTTGRLEVLFTDGTAAPRLATADELTLSLPAELAALGRPELASLIQRDAAGWSIHAPDEATLAAARLELGLAAGAPVPLPIDVALEPSLTGAGTGTGASLRAQKLVSFGTFVGNPEPPLLTFAGQRLPEESAGSSADPSRGPTSAPLLLPHDTELALAAELPSAPAEPPTEPSAEISYRWFASFGEVRHYTQPLATISAEAEDRGMTGSLLVVARTPAGGVSWKLVAVTVPVQ